MTLGPVQVLVVGFAEPRFSGEVLAELSRLEESGVVRLIDMVLVARDETGALETLDLPDSAFGQVLAALFAEASDQPREAASGGWSLAESIPPGGTAAVALIEHRWAGPLRAAIAASGGQPLDETWLAPADLELLESLLDR